jgi:hypothetical protein
MIIRFLSTVSIVRAMNGLELPITDTHQKFNLVSQNCRQMQGSPQDRVAEGALPSNVLPENHERDFHAIAALST